MSREGPEDTRRTTIYDLARLAGASPSSVSAVLNGTWQKRRLSQKLADRVIALAEAQGYTVNTQASLLRRDRSNVVGMIVPKYDNRYFGDIAERFEAMARLRGLFPVVTCTQRDADLEFEAAKEMISWQAECIFLTGATNPDRITTFCNSAGVRSINIDLPGTLAPSVISDNYQGARTLTDLILDRCEAELGWAGPLRFVGGRLTDHNTTTRLRGFLDAQRARGIEVPAEHIVINGYSAQKAAAALAHFTPTSPVGLFVNSTISLEGVVRWFNAQPDPTRLIRYGCFDWDPFGAFLPGNVGMMEQDVERMMEQAFSILSKTRVENEQIMVPCRQHVF